MLLTLTTSYRGSRKLSVLKGTWGEGAAPLSWLARSRSKERIGGFKKKKTWALFIHFFKPYQYVGFPTTAEWMCWEGPGISRQPAACWWCKLLGTLIGCLWMEGGTVSHPSDQHFALHGLYNDQPQSEVWVDGFGGGPQT